MFILLLHVRSLRKWILLLFAGAIVVGCAVGPRFIPITDPTQRLAFQGFSILPPQGKGWVISPSLAQDPVRVVFFKHYRERITQPTIIATVSSFRIPDDVPIKSRADLLQEIIRIKEIDMRTGRHRPVAFKSAPDNSLGSDCVRYDGTVEDRGVPEFPQSVFLITFHGLVCLHPDNQRLVIQVEYSQRRLPEEHPLPVELEGEPFVKSLVFNYLQTQSSL